MAEEKGKKPPPIGLISLAAAAVIYTVVFSLLAGKLVTPLEGKGFGFLVILFLYAVIKLVLGLILWVRDRGRKASP